MINADAIAPGMSLKRRQQLLSIGYAMPVLVTILIFLMVPIMFIIAFSVMKAGVYGGVEWEFSLEAYIQLLFERQLDESLVFNDAYIGIILRSIKLALMTTVFTLLFAFPVAVWLAMQPKKKRNLFIFLLTIPFWVNILIRTFSWLLILRDTGLVNNVLISLGVISEPIRLLYNDAAVLVGLVYTYAPFMVLPIYSTLEKMDRNLLEAAQDLYHNKIKTLFKVVLPLAKPGIFAGCILTFVPSLGALVAPELLGGGKQMMLGNLIYRQFSEARNWPFGASLSLVLLVMVMLVLMIAVMRADRNELKGGS
ncbi:ABC transporter permease [Candidatus Endobugula sertula]|uniref:ABC transporter permease n=1 Tax=Candidatus Endobugula sertula TaxID=62101 RepID=A0A1D2QM92_9GAMM|nr:ABC transporter permease [Candidatus Endobugula sertula]